MSWYERVSEMKSFETAVSDHLPDALVAAFRAAGAAVADDVAELVAAS